QPQHSWRTPPPAFHGAGDRAGPKGRQRFRVAWNDEFWNLCWCPPDRLRAADVALREHGRGNHFLRCEEDGGPPHHSDGKAARKLSRGIACTGLARRADFSETLDQKCEQVVGGFSLG